MDLILRHKTPRARILRMQASDEEICFRDLQHGDYPFVNQRDTPPPTDILGRRGYLSRCAIQNV